MPSRKKNVYRFLAVWDMLGLESLWDVDEALALIENHDKQKTWNTLKGEKTLPMRNPIPLNELIIRARANSQRSYEIYTFTSEFNRKEVETIFAECPQPLVEWIRENGNKIYSDYVKSDGKMIV
jgi:hypothetical protein